MGWYGLHQALKSKDPSRIARELSPRANPNTPADALALAVRALAPEEARALHAWADGWLRDPDNDCLRARGDARWQAMCEVEMALRAAVRP